MSAMALDVHLCFGQATEPPRPSPRQTLADAKGSQAKERKEAGLQALMESVRLGQQRLTGIEKARFLLDASEALWPVDAEQARSAVKLAWDAALEDKSARSPLEPDATLARILGSLSVHDVLLAEKLRSTLPDKERQGYSPRSYQFFQDQWFGGNHGSGSKHWTVVLTAIDEALAAGKSEMAIDAIRKVMADGYNDDLVSFLSYLRQRLPEAADRMYLELVHRNWFSPFVPPAEVVVLSSYLFTPGIVYLLSARNGALYLNNLPLGFGPAPQDVDPEVRRAFYEMAAKAFLASEPTDEKVLALRDIAAYRAVTVLAINKLLPHFESEAQEYVPALRARVDSLSRWAPLNPKDLTEPMMARVLSDPKFDRYGPGAGPTERDDAYYEREALLFATHGQFDRARESANVIIRKDEARQKTLIRINSEEASRAQQRGDFARVLEIVSTEELPEATEVSLLAAAARGVARQDEGLAASVFAEARQKAEKAEDAGLQVRLFAELAISALAIGSNQSWECLELAIRAFARKEEAEKDREKAASGPVDSQLRTAVRRFGKVDSEKTMFAIDSVKSARLRPWLMLGFAKALLEN